MSNESPITDAEVDRVALDIMRWGCRETARHLIAFQRSIRRASASYDALNQKVSYSVTAMENVNGWTMPMGGLNTRGNDDPTVVLFEPGDECVEISGHFDADTLLAIAMHMRSQQ